MECIDRFGAGFLFPETVSSACGRDSPDRSQSSLNYSLNLAESGVKSEDSSC